MSIRELHTKAVIKDEPGIISKKGGGFHMPASFAEKHLFYVVWGDEYVCSENYFVEREYLDSLGLYQIVSGDMRVQYRNRAFTARAGDVIFLDLRYPHYYKAEKQMQIRQYLIGGNVSQAYYDMLYDLHGCHYPDKGKTSVLFSLLQNELCESVPDDHKISALLHQILSILVIQERPALSPAIKEAQEYIGSHFQEPIQVESIAESVALSRYHFSRTFKKETGFTPHEYLQDVRLRYSKQLLTETELPVEEVAYRCGFSSATHFIRVFKKRTMITPAAFRKYFDPIGFR